MQDYQEFFACARASRPKAGINLTILLILSKIFSYKKESIPLFSTYKVSYLIRLALFWTAAAHVKKQA